MVIRTSRKESMLKEYTKNFDRPLRSRRIGPEIECTAVCKETLREPSVAQVTKLFENMAARDGWKAEKEVLMTDGGLEEACTGASKRIGGYNVLVTTDVGTGTIEACIPPSVSLKEAERHIKDIMGMVCEVADMSGIYILGLGFSPVSEPSSNLVMPKPRYTYFTEKVFGRNIGEIALSSAAQCHIEVSSDELPRVLNVLNGFSPALIALTANSTIVGGEFTEYLEFRGRAYDSLVRSGGIEAKRVGIADRFGTIEECYECMLDFRPIFTKRNGEYYGYNGRVSSMREYLANGKTETHSILNGSRMDIKPELVDMFFLEGTVWWDARPKGVYGTVELRPCSFQPSTNDLMAINAAALGLVENSREAERMITRYSLREIEAARADAMANGVRARIGGGELHAFAEGMLGIASAGLSSIAEDVGYLAPLFRNLERMESPADRSRKRLVSIGKESEGRDDALRTFVEAHRYSL
ncbi:MAG: hypothetical protein KGH74_00970 [Candidatus Micrarchaeota archaeon]|nr:hypothetical protein [Candidatus Micrarchaeota archaeon]